MRITLKVMGITDQKVLFQKCVSKGAFSKVRFSHSYAELRLRISLQVTGITVQVMGIRDGLMRISDELSRITVSSVVQNQKLDSLNLPVSQRAPLCSSGALRVYRLYLEVSGPSVSIQLR